MQPKEAVVLKEKHIIGMPGDLLSLTIFIFIFFF